MNAFIRVGSVRQTSTGKFRGFLQWPDGRQAVTAESFETREEALEQGRALLKEIGVKVLASTRPRRREGPLNITDKPGPHDFEGSAESN